MQTTMIMGWVIIINNNHNSNNSQQNEKEKMDKFLNKYRKYNKDDRRDGIEFIIWPNIFCKKNN